MEESEKSPPTPRPLGLLLAMVMLGSGATALVASLLVALWGAQAQSLPLFATWGLLTPWALVVAVAVGLWIPFAHPGEPRVDLRHVLSTPKSRVRALVAGPGIVLLWFALGQLALRLLASFEHRPAVGGVVVAASSLGLLAVGSWCADRATDVLAAKLDDVPRTVLYGVGFALPTVLVATLVAVGTTSGTGSPFALFGVFKRPELDLSGVVQAGFLLACAYGGGLLSMRAAPVVPAAVLVVAAAGSGFAVASAHGMDFRQATEVERASGLPAFGLSLLRASSDDDGDGYAGAFGGRDCDDTRASVHPGATDVPENGVDEDCRGGDKKKRQASLDEQEPEQKKHRVPDSPNVLLLTIDTLRWDVGFLDPKARDGLSPRLDELAGRSTVFERAYALASYTSKSLGPMLLGRYPSETKRTFEHFDRFDPSVPFLQERLQDAGITTVSVQGYWYFFFESYGFERGWDILDKEAAPRTVKIEGDNSSNGKEVADRSIARLEEVEKSGEQFFMWTHWVDPHTEYVRHEEFDFGGDPRERYDSEVAFVDHQVGRVLDALSRLSLDGETVIIVTSDHGEAFGEHGMIRHGFEAWEELVRVPLLVHVPEVPARRVEPRRSIIDVTPTVLETFGMEIPSSVRGTSLLRDVLAPEDAQLETRPVLVDMPQGPHNQQRRALYSGDYKLITSAGRVLGLYDLKSDPAEKKDLSESEEKLEPVQSRMNEFLDTLDEIPATR